MGLVLGIFALGDCGLVKIIHVIGNDGIFENKRRCVKFDGCLSMASDRFRLFLLRAYLYTVFSNFR